MEGCRVKILCELTGKIMSWLTDEGVKDVLDMKRANASGKEGVGGRGVKRYGLPNPPFYFHAAYLSIRKQFIPEQLLAATYAFTPSPVLKRKISSPRKGNRIFGARRLYRRSDNRIPWITRGNGCTAPPSVSRTGG